MKSLSQVLSKILTIKVLFENIIFLSSRPWKHSYKYACVKFIFVNLETNKNMDIQYVNANNIYT